MATLTKAQRRQLYDAMVEAFPTWNDLSAMVELELDGNLEAISARVNTTTTIVLDLITWAQSRDLLGELVAAALAARPKNAALTAFAAGMAASTPPPPPLPDPAADPVADSALKERYEHLVWKCVELAGAAAFRVTMASKERAVCRVEFPRDVPQGTGFLVGPDLMVTNYHVLKPVLEGGQSPDTVFGRFDYAASADGTTVNDGRVVGLAAGTWRVNASPIDKLDYALVRLAERVGDDVLPEGAGGTRGWLTPEAHAFSQGESVFILQHPKAAPLKIAAGGVVKVQEHRVHYLANTLNGSSGSPCFTSDWRLAALHRSGDTLANVGVPWAAVLGDLRAALPGFQFA